VTRGLTPRIAERIRREGPITFADYMSMALYDESGGFFAVGGGAGRAGRDFVTSPEVGTLFGALLARSIDASWRDLRGPDPFLVVEVGAGRGRLAADVLRAQPECAPALRYVLVERSAVLRGEQRELLTLEPPDEALGPFARVADADEPPEVVRGTGPIATSLAELPAVQVDGVVLANELLDNLPVHIVERTPDGWCEIRVGLGESDRLEEVPVPAPDDLSVQADEVAAGSSVPAGARLPVPVAAREWLAHVATLIRNGVVVIVDYADDAAGLVARGQESWLRTYRGHARGTDVLDAPGSQDLTYDVPLEYLRSVAARAGFSVDVDTTQAEWLRGLGIDDLVAAGDQTWRERAHLGDLEAVAGRSRGVEAAALTDPAGLGAHRVLVLRKGADGRR